MPAKLFRYFLREDIYRNSVKLFLGHAGGQVLIFLTGPILSRLYSPDEFGNYAFMSSLASMISLFSTGSYEFAIITVKKESEAQALSFLSIILSFTTSTITAIILLLLFLKSGAWQQNMTGTGWGLIPVFVFIQGLYNTLNYLLNRKQKYGTMSVSRSLRAAAMIPVQLLMGIRQISSGLFLGMVSGHLIGMLYQLIQGLKKKFFNLKMPSIIILKDTARKHYKFPLFFMPEQLVNNFSVQIPVYLLKFFFTHASVGLFALPQRFLSIPIVLIGNSLGHIYFRDAALKCTSQSQLGSTTIKIFQFLFRLGVVPFSILTIFGDVIIPFFFGEEWQQAGIYVMLLSPWLFFVLIGSPLSNIFTVKGLQRKSLLINLGLLIGRGLAFLAGTFIFHSPLMAVGFFSAISFVFWIFIVFYNLHLVNINIWPLLLKTLGIWISFLLGMGIIRILILKNA
jgi:O-antigen/teichoic acid export membrane protein